MQDEPTSGSEGPGTGTSQIRDDLIAQLHQTVEGVSAAIDEAGRRAFEAAQADARRHAEQAAQRIEAASGTQLRRLRELSDELVERSRSLADQVAALSGEAERAAGELRAHGPLDDVEITPASSAAPASPAGEATSPEVRLRRFRRRASEQESEIPAGVRVIVLQMRINGSSESEIEDQLREMGVADPAGVLARVES